MATGHTTYSTFHADSIQSLVHRLENKPIEIPRVLIPALDGISIQIQTRVGGKRVRRNKGIIEIIGIDPHSHELLTNEAFRWDNTVDEYIFTGKSYIFEKIMMKANLNRVEIMDETKRRQLVIEWCLKKGIRDYKDFARVVAEYYVHPEDVMRQVYEDMQVGGKKRRKKVADRDMDLSRDEEEVDVADFPPKVRQKYQTREAKEQATRAKNDANISKTDDPTKRSKLIANEEARREKVEARLQSDLLKDQAYYVPLKQLTPLAKDIDLGDVSSLNDVEGRRMLKNVRAELNKRAKATMNIEKLTDEKRSKAVEAEESRVNKAMVSLKSSLANRVQRSANPRWWHKWL